MWSFKFPHNVNDEGVPMANCVGKFCHELQYPVYPTSFTKCHLPVAVLFLWKYKARILKNPGMLFGIYMILAGVERFYRIDPCKYQISCCRCFSFTQAEMISLIMVIGGTALIINGLKNKKTATLQHG
jgi:phosphatidylglycerol:prolipoprotein diacylglycerol transferase